MTSPEEPDSSSFESGCGLEDASEYSLGGYYPIRRGQFLPNNSKNAKYIVKQKLGWVIFRQFGWLKTFGPSNTELLKSLKGRTPTMNQVKTKLNFFWSFPTTQAELLSSLLHRKPFQKGFLMKRKPSVLNSWSTLRTNQSMDSTFASSSQFLDRVFWTF